MSDTFDPKTLPIGVRAFLGAIAVWPNVLKASRLAAEALHPAPAPPLSPPIRRGGKEAAPVSEAEQQASAQRRERQLERVAGHIRLNHYRRMKSDAAYKAAFDAAWDLGRGGVQDKILEIAEDGYEETIVSPDGVTVKYKRDHRLLLRSAEALFPETWGKRKVEHSGGVQLGIASMTDEELERIARGGLDGAAAAAPAV